MTTSSLLFQPHPAIPLYSQFQAVAAASQRGLDKILSQSDAAPFEVRNANAKTPCLIICDHASNAVPKKLGSLGLPQAELNRHIGVDIGSRDIGYYMSKQLDATVIMANYSRLVVDLNRGVGSAAQIPIESDYTLIPGNLNLPISSKDARINELYLPYHVEVSKHSHRLITENTVPPVLIFVHSCTDEMNGKKRPWEIGVLWDQDEKLAMRFINALRKNNPDFNIGENEPYTLKNPPPGNSIERHAVRSGLPHLVLEFRQDLVDTPEKAQKMAELALESLRPILADQAFFKENYKVQTPMYYQAMMAFEHKTYAATFRAPQETVLLAEIGQMMTRGFTSSKPKEMDATVAWDVGKMALSNANLLKH